MSYSLRYCTLEQQNKRKNGARFLNNAMLASPPGPSSQRSKREVRLPATTRCPLRQSVTAPAPTQSFATSSARSVSRRPPPGSAGAVLQPPLRRTWQRCCKRLSRILDCTGTEAVILYVLAAVTLAHPLLTKLLSLLSPTRRTVLRDYGSLKTVLLLFCRSAT